MKINKPNKTSGYQTKKAQGFFPTEVVKIILAVLALVILFYLAFSLYDIFSRKTELEQARAVLEEIFAKIENLKQEGDYAEILIIAPANWAVISFDKKLCICGKDYYTNKEECIKNGICRDGKKPFLIENVCSLNENCFVLKKIGSNQELTVTEQLMGFKPLPFKLLIVQKNDKIELKTQKEIIAESLLNKILASDEIKLAIVKCYFPGTEEGNYKNYGCSDGKDYDSEKTTRFIEKINSLITEKNFDWEIKINQEGISKEIVIVSDIEVLKQHEAINYYHYLNYASFPKKGFFKSPSGKKYNIELKIGELKGYYVNIPPYLGIYAII